MIKAVGFDFDGTIIMSEGEKVKIFQRIFARRYGIKRGVGRAYVGLLGKANRIEKIQILVRKFLKRKPTQKEVRAFSQEFGQEYQKILAACPILECTNMLKELKQQVKYMFLLSLEKKTDVRKLAQHCRVAKYFDEILGGPKKKVENFKHVMMTHKFKPSEMLYVGDSKGDVLISQRLKIHSIGVQRKLPYRKLLKKLGAHFTFSRVCDVPFKLIIH